MHELQLLAALLSSSLFLFICLIARGSSRLYRPSSANLTTSPPAPPRLPLLGNLHQLGLLPHRRMSLMAQKHGPILLLRLGSVPALVVSSADAAREVMRTHDAAFASRPRFKTFQKLLYNSKDVSFSPYGEYWRKMKSIYVHHLLSNRRVESLRSIREQDTALFIERMQRQPPGHPVNLTQMFSELTYSGIYRAVFGGKQAESDKGRIFSGLMTELMALLGAVNVADFMPWLAWVTPVSGFDKRVAGVFQRLDGFLEEVIQEHLKVAAVGGGVENGDNNFVNALIRCLKENGDCGSVDRDAIKALILDVFSGGTDSTSAVLEWIMVEILRHPAVMQRLKKELRRRGAVADIIREEDLVGMKYLKAVIKETLRYHPPKPVLVPRVARQDVKVGGYGVKAGTILMANAWAIGRDPACWDDPDRFDPDRFLNSEIDFKGFDFELIPFGAGRRGCPGIAFAAATVEVVVANLVEKFEWELPGGAEDMDMTERFGGSVRRAQPLLAIATPSVLI